MPTDLHGCHQEWYQNAADNWRDSGLLTRDEKRHLKIRVGTAINFLYGPYAGARKEPDLMIRAGNLRLPTIIMEAGWSEAWNRLTDDMNIWLVGGNGDVKVVILIKWNKIGRSDRVRGFVEVYSLDPNGMPEQRYCSRLHCHYKA